MYRPLRHVSLQIAIVASGLQAAVMTVSMSTCDGNQTGDIDLDMTLSFDKGQRSDGQFGGSQLSGLKSSQGPRWSLGQGSWRLDHCYLELFNRRRETVRAMASFGIIQVAC